MKNFINILKLFIWNSNLVISKGIHYRFDFFLGLIITLMFTLTGPLIQYLLFTQTNGFPGWNLEQIILFQGTVLISFGLRNTIFGNSKREFIETVINGEFDKFLLKPFSPIALILASSFSIDGIGTFVAGMVLTIYSVLKIKLTITIWKLMLFLLCILLGLLLSAALEIIHSGCIIVTVADGGIRGIIDAYLRFSEYPLDIYPKYLKLTFISFLPIGIFAYFPSQVLLNRIDIKIIFSFISVISFFLISLVFWNSVLKKYTSAGG
ncbi:ABC transporter permease [Senegalia massiliensis]|uniref:ABC transporter permease n=1 Tax=Senegalia massiliensis TaxID=1720316 RepID=UPI0010315B06|nr:ABC-2 family transporter protein [Senegalia massiliensis]